MCVSSNATNFSENAHNPRPYVIFLSTYACQHCLTTGMRNILFLDRRGFAEHQTTLSWSLQMLITLYWTQVYLDQILHIFLFEHCPATGMKKVTRLCRVSLGRSRSFITLEPHGIFWYRIMRGSRKACQRGSKFDNVFFLSWWVDTGSKYRYKWAIISPPAKRHLNGVMLTGRWWHNIRCWLCSFVIFQGIRTSSAKKKPILFLNFLWGSRPSVSPLDPPMTMIIVLTIVHPIPYEKWFHCDIFWIDGVLELHVRV